MAPVVSPRRVIASLALTLLLSVGSVLGVDDEEPSTPVCRHIAKNSLPFCTMVDYHAVVDDDDTHGFAFDAKAKSYYENVNVVLNRFGCSANARYSLYSCDHCREAYKYWVCSIKFQRCGAATKPAGSIVTYHSTLCPHSLSTGDVMASSCVEGITGRVRTCLSLCEDVVRKCPYVLGFQCPTTPTAFFSTDIAVCNKLDRERNPDKDGLWPGTFANA